MNERSQLVMANWIEPWTDHEAVDSLISIRLVIRPRRVQGYADDIGDVVIGIRVPAVHAIPRRRLSIGRDLPRTICISAPNLELRSSFVKSTLRQGGQTGKCK